jgi:hypothetical protein
MKRENRIEVEGVIIIFLLPPPFFIFRWLILMVLCGVSLLVV